MTVGTGGIQAEFDPFQMIDRKPEAAEELQDNKDIINQQNDERRIRAASQIALALALKEKLKGKLSEKQNPLSLTY